MSGFGFLARMAAGVWRRGGAEAGRENRGRTRAFGPAMLPGLHTLAAATLILAAPAAADVRVSAERRPPRVAHYDAAARALGLREWPPYFENKQGIHVFIRLQPDEAGYTIWLPPAAVPPSRQQAEARRLAQEMGWTDGRVYTGSYPWGVSFRAQVREGPAPSGFGRRRYRADLDGLRRWARRLGLAPGWVSIRCEQGRLIRVEPKPVQAWVEDQDYAFYTPANMPPGAVTVRYGLNDRWLAAVLSWAALWVLFPTTALLAARRHIRGLQRMEPMERLLLFRRWQGATVGATVGTALLTSLWLFMMPAGYLFGRLSPILFAVSWLAVSGLVGLQGRLIGLPLEHEAEPEKERKPWYRAAMGELSTTLIGVLVAAGFLWLFTSRKGWGAALTLPLLVGIIVVVVGGIVVAATVNWWVTRRRFLSSLEPAPEDLAGAARSLAARLGGGEPRVAVSSERLAVTALKDGRIVLPGPLLEECSVEQAAAVAAAESLYQERQKTDRTGHRVMAVFVGAVVLLAVQAVAAVMLGGRPLVLLWLLLAVVFPMGVVPVSRRWSRLREQVDLEVADALENPRDFLSAVEHLEAVQVSRLDPSLRENAATAQRSGRLQKRLGLD